MKTIIYLSILFIITVGQSSCFEKDDKFGTVILLIAVFAFFAYFIGSVNKVHENRNEKKPYNFKKQEENEAGTGCALSVVAIGLVILLLMALVFIINKCSK